MVLPRYCIGLMYILWLVRAVSEMLSPAENGQVQSYAGVYLFGVIVLLAYGVYYASKLMAMLGGAF